MIHSKVVPGLLALALCAPLAQAAPNPVDPDSLQALKQMGAYLQTLQRFQITTQLISETVLEDGQKLQSHASASLQVQRPDKLKTTMSSSRSKRELIYDGKTATLYTPALKYYGSAETANSISGMVEQLEKRYGIEIPMNDLFVWGTPNAPVDKIESAMNAGQDIVEGTVCDHYAFRQGKVDWQIWIAAGDKPLPRKIVITNRNDEARPQSVSLLDWNLKPSFKDSVFKFTPPKGAQAIGIRPVNAK
jgi:hypothetical protein